MIHKDLKIGLVLGLVLAIFITIKIASSPKLSFESRWQLNTTSSVGSEDVNSTEEISQAFVFEENSLELEGQRLFPGEYVVDIAAQNEKLQNLFAPKKRQPRQIPQENILLEENNIAAVEEDIEQSENIPVIISSEESITEPAIENAVVVQEEMTEVEPEPVEIIERYDYESAPIIKTEKFHIVRRDQNLSEISSIYYGSASKWQKIVDANTDLIEDPNKIKPGMKLIIPD